MREASLGRILGRVALWAALAAALVYLADWAVWKARGANGMGEVTVSRTVVAPLKGGKEEYYPDGSTTVVCSESLFPQVGGGACWWMRGHRVVMER